MKWAITALCVFCLSACATQTIYDWGKYEESLYAGYKDPAKVENMRINLETHITSLEKSEEKVAPGLYAELGTLYLQLGSEDRAIDMYAHERDVWPESRGLMTALIETLQKRASGKKRTNQ